MPLGYLKPVGGNMRLRYARPGYDANDLSLAPNLVAFDSANPGIFSIYASGRWNGNATLFSTKTQIVSWPTLSYVPVCTIYISTNNGSYNDAIFYGLFGVGISNTFQRANGDYGLDVKNDGLYWRYFDTAGPDHWSIWYWVHRMPAI